MPDLSEQTIGELQSLMEKGELSSIELVDFYLDRIAQVDKEGPKINSILELNPDVREIAEALDAERSEKKCRGPLHGIPIIVKDNIDTADKMHTSAGSLALENHYASEDAFLVQKLRAAGAIILGKANMTEWANFMTENMPNGYSSRGGQVLNPYGPGRFDVGGSSSGSAAAVAAGLASAAVGTETSGSILSPASANSLVGIKPTVGQISRSGIIPISHSQDTAGPIARSVADAALLFWAMAGKDPKDPATLRSNRRFPANVSPPYPSGEIRGLRIGVPREPYYDSLHADRLKIMEEAIRALRDLGVEVIDPVLLPSKEGGEDYTVLPYEFKPDLNAYLAKVESHLPVHSLNDLIRFNNERPEKALRYGQSLLLAAEEKSGSLTEGEYLRSRLNDLRRSRKEGIDRAIYEHNLTALLFPANYGAGIAAKAGYPSITVPGGYTPEGEPFGVTFTARAFEESALIPIAYAFEKYTRHRKPPTL
ncbi:MAG: amidase [Thermicanus sp.]|nr:amidase [Thermicanus sp.]